ncbi:MAG: hypothetical protein LC790_12715 [Actinobacteria bacterium]|nr:hypothetical protein [Actinomycetota bacterium]
MSVAVVWGWYGVGGALVMLAGGLFALWAVFANLQPSSAGHILTRLLASPRAALPLVFTVMCLGGSGVSFWGAFHEQRSQFTVQTLREEECDDGDYGFHTCYEVDDTKGRTFVAERDDWEKLREGDDVECRVAAPPLLPGRLLSCRQQPR